MSQNSSNDNSELQNLETLNAFLPNINVLYDLLETGTYWLYLPEKTSLAVPTNYLLAISNREFFCIKKESVKYNSLLKRLNVSKEQIYSFLQDMVEQIKNKNLGFDVEC